VLARQPNVLLLDEPTNDLDLDTLRILEDFLDDWPGTLVVVSHDRAFLDRTVDQVLAVEHGGVRMVRGGYEGWRKERAEAPRTAGSSAPSVGTAPMASSSGAAAASAGSVVSSRPGKERSPATLRRLFMLAEREMAASAAKGDAIEATLLAASAAGEAHERLAALGHDLAAAHEALAAAEERWLDLAAEGESRGISLP